MQQIPGHATEASAVKEDVTDAKQIKTKNEGLS